MYLGWASSDLAELLHVVIGPNMTMYVLFDLFLSYQVGVYMGHFRGYYPPTPILPLLSRVGALVVFSHYKHPKLIQLEQKQQKLTIFTLFG